MQVLRAHEVIRRPRSSREAQELAPRAHIGYLVGYESTNIYRIWVPHKRKVISARDVIFDEGEFYDGKRLRFTDELIDELEEAIKRISLTPQHDQEEIQHTQDQPILDGEFETFGGRPGGSS